MLLESTFKHTIRPIGKRGTPETLGGPGERLIQYSMGEPGVKIGQ